MGNQHDIVPEPRSGLPRGRPLRRTRL